MIFLNNCLCEFDWALFANVVGAIANFGLLILGIFSICYITKQIIISREQIVQNKNINEADIIIKINSNFFTEETKNLFFLIESSLLKYQKKINVKDNIDYHYFEVDEERLRSFPKLKEYLKNKNITFYPSSDIDYLLLNHFEDLGIMNKSKLLKKDHIFENFNYYIVTTCNNPEINSYIRELKASNSSLYSNLIELYKKYKSSTDLDL